MDVPLLAQEPTPSDPQPPVAETPPDTKSDPPAQPAEKTALETPAPLPLNPSGALPWEMPLTPPNLPGKKLQSVKEIFQFLGIDTSQWRNFYQDRPFDVGEEEYINRLLARMPRVGRESLYSFRKTDWQPQELMAAPQEHQGETFLLKGRAKFIRKVALPEEILERFEFTHHYQVRVVLNNHAQETIVCLSQLPKYWPQEGELDEPVEIEAVFVKSSPPAEGVEEPTKLVFVANNIIWLPEKEDVKHGITPDVLALVQQGFDASSFDHIRHHNLKELTEEDREPFYQLLSTLGKLPADTPALKNAAPINIADCLKNPNDQPGKFVSVLGSARRIDRIEIDSSEIRTRFGIDHYFEIYVFVPLHDQQIKWARSASDPNPRIFDNHFPVTVCVLNLPPGLKAAPKTRETVQLHGSILKIWSYKPQGQDSDLVQPSPMVLGSTVSIVPLNKPQDTVFTQVVLGMMVLGLAGLLYAIFGQIKSDKPRLRSEDAPVNFNEPT